MNLNAIVIPIMFVLIVIGIGAQNVIAFGPLTGGPPYENKKDIETLFLHDRMDSVGQFWISGEIKNTGDTDMKYLKIIAHLYDSNNQTIAVGDGYADETLLKPGDTSLFDVLIDEEERKSNDIKHYDLEYRWD